MNNKYQRLINAATDFCFHLIPTDILKKIGEDVPASATPTEITSAIMDLFEVRPICGESSITVEIFSQHRKVRGILIGAKGKNIAAIRHLLQIIGKQERINTTQVTVIRNKNDDNDGKE